MQSIVVNAYAIPFVQITDFKLGLGSSNVHRGPAGETVRLRSDDCPRAFRSDGELAGPGCFLMHLQRKVFSIKSIFPPCAALG